MKTIQQDLKSSTLNKAADIAQNRPLWRLMFVFGPSGACEKRIKITKNTVF